MKKCLLATMVASSLLVGCGGGSGKSNAVADNLNNGGQTTNNGSNTGGSSTPDNGNTNVGDHVLNGGTVDVEIESHGGVQHREVKYTPYPLGDLDDNKVQYQNENTKTGRLVKADFNIANPTAPQSFLDQAKAFNGLPVNSTGFTSPIGTRHTGFLNTDLFFFDPYKQVDYDSVALDKYYEDLAEYRKNYKQWIEDKANDPDLVTTAPIAPAFDPKLYLIPDMIQMKANLSTVTGNLNSVATPTIKAHGKYDDTNRGVAFVYAPSVHAYYVITNASNNLQNNLVTKPKVEQQVLNYQDESGKWKTEILVTVQNENSENTPNKFTKNGKSNPSNSLKQSYIYEMVDLSGKDSTAHIYANVPTNYAFSQLLRARINGQICEPNTAQKRYCFPQNSIGYRLKASYTPALFYGTTAESRNELSIADLMTKWMREYIIDPISGIIKDKNFAFTVHFKDSGKTSNTRLIYLDRLGNIDSDSGLLNIVVPMKDQIVFAYYDKLYKGGYRPAIHYDFNIHEKGVDCTVNHENSSCFEIDHSDMSGRFLGSRWIYNETAYLQLKHQIDDNIGN